MLKQSYVFFVALIFCFSCERNDKIVKEAEKSEIDIEFQRLDKELFSFQSKSDARTFLDKHADFVRSYLDLPYPVRDSQFIDIFYDFYSNNELKAFYEGSQKEFGDFSGIQKEFQSLFQYIHYYYPDYVLPSVQMIFTGFKFESDVVLSDSSVIISYDYFLGPEALHRPQLYEYFLERYQPPYLVPLTALAISGRFNNADMKDESMLASMIYYGKSHYFVERVMPRLPDSLNIMYSESTLNEVENNIDVIWGHFIEKSLLYNKIRFINEKYCGERPSVPEIGNKCPGRIGRWLGWQIVRSYMKANPEVSLQELMADPDAEKIFRKSNYKPRK